MLPATLEEEAFVTQYEEDKHGAPVPASKNCVVAGKVREVEWKEPNEALITTLETGARAHSHCKERGGIDPAKRKESLFRQQQRHYMRLAAAPVDKEQEKFAKAVKRQPRACCLVRS